MVSKKIDFEDRDKVKEIYIDSFPPCERVELEQLWKGVFKDFKMFAFYEHGSLLGIAHLCDTMDFVHLNYLAVVKEKRGQGIGSAILSWIKKKFSNKPIAVDVENVDKNAANAEQRIKRLRFYKKNGFNIGKYKFVWNGVKMFYLAFGDVDGKTFMDYIQIIFPTIKNIELIDN